MFFVKRFFIVILFLVQSSCDASQKQPTSPTATPSVKELLQPSTPKEEDKRFQNVFAPLDGVWSGTFRVYTNTDGQEERRPVTLDSSILTSPPYRLSLSIDVHQEYVSETPYFQRVTIKDTYQNKDGSEKIEESTGVNKIQNGKLWCVVEKPSETVIHSGTTEGEHTIVWQRDLRNPLKIEFFEETVLKDQYTIVGWGYYGKDDPQKGPRTYFHGVYHRVTPE